MKQKKFSLATRSKLSRKPLESMSKEFDTHTHLSLRVREEEVCLESERWLAGLWKVPPPKEDRILVSLHSSPPSCIAANKLPFCLASLIPDVPASAFRNAICFFGGGGGKWGHWEGMEWD